MPRKTSFSESANECPASASKAADPEVSPAPSFASATTTLAQRALEIVRRLVLSAALRKAALECRRGILANTPRPPRLTRKLADCVGRGSARGQWPARQAAYL